MIDGRRDNLKEKRMAIADEWSVEWKIIASR